MAILQPERLSDTIAALYHMSFVERQDISTLQSLVPIFGKIFGQDTAKEILTKALNLDW